MNEIDPEETKFLKNIKDIIEQGRMDEAVRQIGNYLNQADEDYIEKLEEIIERVSAVHGGTTVIRFLIENLIIDIPSLLENLSKRDQLLRYSFLLLLKKMCEKESDLFLPYSEELLNSEDPNVREAILQLIIFIANGPEKIGREALVRQIAETLNDSKEYVVEKAVQALKAIGKESPSMVTKKLSEYIKEFPEMEKNEQLKERIDNILKSIVSVEKLDEIVEEELEKEEKEALGKPKEEKLKKKDLELKEKKFELEEKEKQLEEKKIQEKEETLKQKEELLEKEKALQKVELELQKKGLEDKQKEIMDKEAKRVEGRLKTIKAEENTKKEPSEGKKE
ncbi:MAG: HEAT repeat domain-containing protein [Promethearchaeia archaeon]